MAIDGEQLREEIRKVYSEVARDPKRGYHFHTDPDYAVDCIGSVARGVTEADLKDKSAQFVNPKVFAEKMVAADKVVSP
jgi:hypothetical protein